MERTAELPPFRLSALDGAPSGGSPGNRHLALPPLGHGDTEIMEIAAPA